MNISLPDSGIVLLIGASNSGKTTLLNKWIEEGQLIRSEVISSDDYRLIVSDMDFVQWNDRPKDEADLLFEQYQALSAEAFRMMDEVLKSRCKLNKLTFVDATHLFPEDRKHFISIAKEYHVPITAIVLDIPEDVLLERDEHRANPRGKKRVKQQYHNLKKGLRYIKKEGFRSVYFVRLDDHVELVRKKNELVVDVGAGIDFIGDVHGCFEELITLLQKLGYKEDDEGLFTHPEGRKFMSVGDVMSRGPHSLESMLFFMKHVRQELAYMTDSNHGWKIVRWLDGRNVTLHHGDEKVAEEFEQYEKMYGSEKTAELKEDLKSFLMSAPSHYVLMKNGVYTAVCTHAGIKDEYIGKTSPAISDFSRYGDTDGFNEDGKPVRKDWFVHHKGSMLIIWGHDPKPQPLVINNTINIDQGVVFGGKLTALRYPETEFVSVKAAKDYSGDTDNPLIEWEKKRFDPPNIERFINGFEVQTDCLGVIKVQQNNVKAAIDTVSHYTVPIEQLVYIPPTMSPTPDVSALPDYLEHPREAINYYRNHGIEKMVAQKKHMGSRAILLLFKSREAAEKAVGSSIEGVIYTRSGRRFFDQETESKVVGKLVHELFEKNYFEKHSTDYVLLDAEIMPWNLKAKELIRSQYAHVSENAILDRSCLLKKMSDSDIDVNGWLSEYEAKLMNAKVFKEVFQKYCWNIDGLEEIQIAPFHVLAHSGETFFDKPHTWHMEMNRKFSEGSSLFVETESKVIENTEDEAEVIAWWEQMTEDGHEGIVIKPEDFIPRYKGRLIQPAIKVRGRKYLNIIYGMDYLHPENIARLKKRNTGKKQKNALKEFALGLEGIKRFVERDSMERVHECVLAVLAMESDPVDPRL